MAAPATTEIPVGTTVRSILGGRWVREEGAWRLTAFDGSVEVFGDAERAANTEVDMALGGVEIVACGGPGFGLVWLETTNDDTTNHYSEES